MKKINLGNTDMQIPLITVGCMRLNSLSENEVETYILNCLEQGANFFDHADIYGGGECETLFGKVLEKHPEQRSSSLLLC